MKQLSLVPEIEIQQINKIEIPEQISTIITMLITEILKQSDESKINILNDIKLSLHEISPLKNEPVDCVLWIRNTDIIANDYNPNAVAPPEMDLLKLSINADGYTQPIVTFNDNNLNSHYTVIDGFHRYRVGKEVKEICDRIKGYLPITIIRQDREDRSDRIAATIRHNRARGKHRIDSMSDIVIELKKRNKSDKWIAEHLGMEPDEVLRLAQISGLAEMFKDREFSKAWEPEFVEEKTNDGAISE